MAARGSKIGRIREYFRSADIDEAEVVFALVGEDMARRKQKSQPTLPFERTRRAKRPKKSSAEPAPHQTEVATSTVLPTGPGTESITQ